MKRNRKLIEAAGTLIIVLLLLIIIMTIKRGRAGNELDTANEQQEEQSYYNTIRPGGALERYYAFMGSLTVTSVELPMRENYQTLVENTASTDGLDSTDESDSETEDVESSGSGIGNKQYITKSDRYKHKVWYPNNMSEPGIKYPLVIIVNDLNKTYRDYESYFEHLASWGFIVIGNNDMNAISGESSIESLNYILSLNGTETSNFYNKVDIKNIGISGRTQGGVGAINAVTKFNDSHYFTSLVTLSMLSIQSSIDVGWLYDVSRINTHYLSLAGDGDTDFIKESDLSEVFEYCNVVSKNCTATGQIRDTNRDNIIDESDAYQTAWFLMTLKSDTKASEVFTRDFPEIISNKKYINVRIKNAVVYNRI